MNWLDICALEEINALGSRIITGPKGDIAIFRTSDDEVFALDDRCPHKGGPLSQGIVHDAGVTCPLHNWVISLATGEAQGPDEGRVRTFPLRVEDGRLWLDLTALKGAA